MNASKLVKIGNYVINPEYIAAITVITKREAAWPLITKHYSYEQIAALGFKPVYYRFVECSWAEARKYCAANPTTSVLSHGCPGYVDFDPSNPANACWERERGYRYDEKQKRAVECINVNRGLSNEQLDEPLFYVVHMAVADGGINYDHMKFTLTIAEHEELMRAFAWLGA